MKKLFFVLVILISIVLLRGQPIDVRNMTEEDFTPEFYEYVRQQNTNTRGVSFNFLPHQIPYNLPDDFPPLEFHQGLTWDKDFEPYISNYNAGDPLYMYWSPNSVFNISTIEGEPSSLRFEPVDPLWHGSQDVAITISDEELVEGSTNQSTWIFNITVDNDPDAPIFNFPNIDNDIPLGYRFNTDEDVPLTINFVDYMTDTVRYINSVDNMSYPTAIQLYVAPVTSGMSYYQSNSGSGSGAGIGTTVTFIPPENVVGDYQDYIFLLTAKDRVYSQTATRTIKIRVNQVNDPPEILEVKVDGVDVQDLMGPFDQGNTHNLEVIANDIDGDILYYSWVLEREGWSSEISTDANFDYLFNDPGNYQLTLTVRDRQDLEDEEIFEVSRSWDFSVRQTGPQFTPLGSEGPFTEPIYVSISAPENATIKYSFNGNHEPWLDYTDPIYLDLSANYSAKTYTIWAYFYDELGNESAHQYQVYVLTGKVETPQFSHLSDRYMPNEFDPVEGNALRVALSTLPEGASIEYSLNNGDTWQDYSSGIDIPSQTKATVIARATKTDWAPSDVSAEHVYIVNDQVGLEPLVVSTTPPLEGGSYCVCYGDSVQIDFSNFTTAPNDAIIHYSLEPKGLPEAAQEFTYDPASGDPFTVYIDASTTIRWWAEYTDPSLDPELAVWFDSDEQAFDFPVQNKTKMTYWENGTVFDPAPKSLPDYYDAPINIAINTEVIPAEGTAIISYQYKTDLMDSFSDWMEYTDPIYADRDIIIRTKASAIENYTTFESEIHEGVYTITGTLPVPLVSHSSPPGSNIASAIGGQYTYGNDVQLSLSMPVGDRWQDATIYYRIDSDDGFVVYDDSTPIELSFGHYQLQAYAAKDNWISSPNSEIGDYYVKFLPPIEIMVDGNQMDPAQNLSVHYSQISVTLSTHSDATVHYTLNGNDPTSASFTYVPGTPLLIGADPLIAPQDIVFKAIAIKDGWVDSEMLEKTFRFVPTVPAPVFSPSDTDHPGPIMVSIMANPDFTPYDIYYLEDPSPADVPGPDNGVLYEGQFEVASSRVIAARAYKDGFEPSVVVSQEYNIANTIGEIVFTPPAGTYTSATGVTLSTVPAEANLFFSVNNVDWYPYEGLIAMAAGYVHTIYAKAELAGSDTRYGQASYTLLDAPIITPVQDQYAAGESIDITITAPLGNLYYSINGGEFVAGISPISLPDVTSNTSIVAYAENDNVETAHISRNYVFNPQLNPPAANVLPGTYYEPFSVVLNHPQSVDIFFSNNGVDFNLYAGQEIDIENNQTLYAYATRLHYPQSITREWDYKLKVRDPQASLASGEYAGAREIAFSVNTDGAEIMYNTTGADAAEWIEFDGNPIEITDNTDFWVKGTKDNWVPSSVIHYSYIINGTVQEVAFNPVAGVYYEALEVAAIELSTVPADAQILYSLDGSSPSIVYAGPIAITANTLIRARAIKDSWLPSAESQAQYYLKVSSINDNIAATIHYEPFDVTLSTTTDDTTIYYTLDGTLPSAASTEYIGPITISGSSTLRAVAIKAGWLDSDYYQRSFVINQRVATPVIAPAEIYHTSSPVEISINTATDGATISYRTSVNGIWEDYEGPFQITETTLIQAKATKEGWVDSEIATTQYIIELLQVAAPVFSPEPRTYNEPQEVSISSTTEDAQIWYTTDGSDPAENFGTLYDHQPISVTETTTFKAIAIKAGYLNSELVTAEYIIAPDQVMDPVVFPDSGTYTEPFNVVIMSPTPGATILYQMNEETENWFTYNIASPIHITASSTLRVKAENPPMLPSAVVERDYLITGSIAMGIANKPSGTYNNGIEVLFTAPNPVNAAIHYTLDGSEPTEESALYTSIPLQIDAIESPVVNLKAKAFLDGWDASETATYTYEFQTASVEFDPPGGTYTEVQQVILSSDTNGAQIYYTLDESAPNEGSTLYSGPIIVAANKTIRARAYKDVYMVSPISSEVYAIDLSQYVVANPVFSPASQSSTEELSVLITSNTDGASIRYTTNGIDPSPEYGTIYNGAITVPENTTMFIKAIAYKTDWTPSAVVAAYYNVTGTVAEVEFDLEGGTYTSAQEVVLSTDTEGATIYYTTNGNDPTALSTIYNRPITLSSGTTTIKAVAFKNGWLPSVISSQTYTITGTIAFEQPVFTPAGGTWGNTQYITIADPIPASAQIYYTLDGSIPIPGNPNTYTYNSGQQIDISGDTTITAIAALEGWDLSAPESANYHFQANAPVFSVAGGYYENPQTLSLSTTTTDATIYYTLEEPVRGSRDYMEYTGPISINANSTIKAYAQKDGYQDSPIVSQTYAIGDYIPAVATPVFSVASGIYQTAQTVAISTSTEDVIIRYTTDGSDPSETVGTVYTSPITISGNTTLKAIAYKTNWLSSQIAVASYVITGKVAAVQFNPTGDTYQTAQTVVLTSATEGAYFYYTTDGSDPSETNGTLYTTGIHIPLNSENFVLRARAFKENWTPSDIGEQIYTITGQVLISTPVFSIDPGTYATVQNLSLGIPDPADAEIRYTTDGSDPSLPTSAYLVYNPANPIVLELGGVRTIKVSAHKENWTPSLVYTAVYNMTGTVVLPDNLFNPEPDTYQTPQNVTLANGIYPAEAMLRYTLNGGEPNEGSPAYNPQTGIAINGTTTLKVKGFMPGWISSATAEAEYIITGTVAINIPVFTPAAGTYTTAQSVVLGNTNPADAVIRYTLDGSEPHEASTLYTEPIQLPLNTVTTIKAKAFKDDWDSSPTYEATYTITGQVAMTMPVFTPAPDTYTSPVAVSLNDVTVPAGAQIYYTTDGSEPNEGSLVYDGTPIQIEANAAMTIRARAYYQDWIPSVVHTGNYVVTGEAGIVGTVFTPEPGIYTTAQTVIISTNTYPLGAVVRYTVDGTEPGESSPIYAPNTPIELGLDSVTVIKAKVFAPGWINSPTYNAIYHITGQVSISAVNLTPTPGTYATAQNVFYSGVPEPNDATIRYTTNGDDPSESDPIFAANLTPPLNSTLNIKLRAFKDGWLPSTVISGYYNFTGQVTLPTDMFTLPAGTYTDTQWLSLNTDLEPSEATLRVTFDGSDPNEYSFEVTPGWGIPLHTGYTEVRVRGFLDGWMPSEIMSAEYNITGQVSIDAPVFSPAPGTYSQAQQIQVNDTNPADAVIHYTLDGTEPTEDSPIISNLLLEDLNTTYTLKIKAFKTDWIPSVTHTAVYVLTGHAAIADPVFSPAPGLYTEAQTVSINNMVTPSGATIRYTTDGTNPTANSTIYTEPIQIGLNSEVTIRARAFAQDWIASEVYVGNYKVTGQVTFNDVQLFTPESGIYTGAQVVTISTNTTPSGAVLRYTTDGSEPTEESPPYMSGIPLPLNSQTTIKVKAWAENWIPSAVFDATYTITGQVVIEDPVFSIDPGTYATVQNLSLGFSNPADAEIRYTTDGSDPSLPTSEYAIYNPDNPITLELNAERTIKVSAHKENWISSPVYTAVYNMTGTVVLADDMFSPAPNTYTTAQQISLLAPAIPNNALLRYTIDGSDPTEQSVAYTTPITVPTNSENFVLKVSGFSEGWISSSVLTATYKVTGTLPEPEFNYPSGLYGNSGDTANGLQVTLSTDPDIGDVKIYYSTDGTDPTEASTLYTEAITVPELAQGFTIRAKAFKQDWIASGISERVYSFLLLPMNVRTVTYEGYVRVLWDNPNVRGLDGFNVYRKATNESSFSQLNSEIVPVSQTIGSDHYYDDYAISNNMSYQYYVTAVYDGMESEQSGVTSAEYQSSDLEITESSRVYPNPAENSTTFQVKLSRNDNVQITISIFDFAGKKIRTLTGSNLNTNLVEITWNLKNDSGLKVGRGTYFARIQASDSAKRTEKVIKISVK
ncbi:MAG: chitobiase/beta-hexosaminidase C-terminal domain-containing protein [Candidatus Cloacimonetes bacterium]|nr:chitobiase/beta-hexosaminidase C-terminal domain-containing protein [Candidatus Cloacimonadota bacterium]